MHKIMYLLNNLSKKEELSQNFNPGFGLILNNFDLCFFFLNLHNSSMVIQKTSGVFEIYFGSLVCLIVLKKHNKIQI